MGIILCKEHGESGIVQMSEMLFALFSNKKNTNIIKLVFNIEEIDERFEHYFSLDEDISRFSDEMNLDYFESEFSKISRDSGCCINCFKDYSNSIKAKVIEKEFSIKS
ncbi:hypothetical protein [Aquimarina aggregata]|uniref:hypothetical protein n=1 Tax=Aquimarina aggregata TaxID=1642818 RepID=UPI002492021A|nr:hypothetical protein [Aquimarina aggregata]